MKVAEICHSISGEGIHAGIPTILVRLVGCNLDCTYCDTKYAQSGGEDLSIDEVVRRVSEFGDVGWVLITGGEPLLQLDDVFHLVARLISPRRKVEIETNGSFSPPELFKVVDCWSVDVKCPSSGPSYGSFKMKWLKKLRRQDQLKFVVGTQEDLDFVRGFLNGVRLKPVVLVSPIAGMLIDKKATVEEYWNREWLQEVAEFCKEQNVRMSLQLHKLIYGNRRGV